jgi:hypothetical protein
VNVTILFGDREKKSSVEQIARRAREAVDDVLARIREDAEPSLASGPVWHSVAMQISCREETEYQQLLKAIERNCAERRVDVMGVRCA